MKRLFVFSLSLVFLILFQVSSVFAESSLEQIVNDQIGVHYRYGGITSKGFDCSGFTMFVYKELGVEIPHASRSQAHLGKAVAKDDLRPGDLVFFNTSGKGISHVGIYLGEGQFVHSANSGVTKSYLSQAYYAKRYVTARRVLGEADYKEAITEIIVADADEPPVDETAAQQSPQ